MRFKRPTYCLIDEPTDDEFDEAKNDFEGVDNIVHDEAKDDLLDTVEFFDESIDDIRRLEDFVDDEAVVEEPTDEYDYSDNFIDDKTLDGYRTTEDDSDSDI